MSVSIRLISFLLFITVANFEVYCQINTVENIIIPAKSDKEVDVTASLYKTIEKPKGVFLLFHQAGSSRGEFIEIAQRFNRMEYIALAVDLRSGKSMNGIDNATYKDAKVKMKNTTYLDAYSDIILAYNYIVNNYQDSLPIYVLGSSYSASLCIRLAAKTQGNPIKGLFLFSPGEYFTNYNGQENYIATFLSAVSSPVWATSSRDESSQLQELLKHAPVDLKVDQFIPATEGQHGAKALWSIYVDSDDYWQSLNDFLENIR